MDGLLIRAARPADAEDIVNIFNPIIAADAYTAFDTLFTVEAERAFIENIPDRAIFHVAVRPSDQRIVGFQSLAPFSDYTSAFDHVGMLATFVDLAHRQQGIAKQLFAATFVAARCQGYEKLFTYIRADNPVALAAYTSQGFRIVGTAQRHAKINGQYIDEIIIEKFL